MVEKKTWWFRDAIGSERYSPAEVFGTSALIGLVGAIVVAVTILLSAAQPVPQNPFQGGETPVCPPGHHMNSDCYMAKVQELHAALEDIDSGAIIALNVMNATFKAEKAACGNDTACKAAARQKFADRASATLDAADQAKQDAYTSFYFAVEACCELDE